MFGRQDTIWNATHSIFFGSNSSVTQQDVQGGSTGPQIHRFVSILIGPTTLHHYHFTYNIGVLNFHPFSTTKRGNFTWGLNGYFYHVSTRCAPQGKRLHPFSFLSNLVHCNFRGEKHTVRSIVYRDHVRNKRLRQQDGRFALARYRITRVHLEGRTINKQRGAKLYLPAIHGLSFLARPRVFARNTGIFFTNFGHGACGVQVT